MGIYLVRGFYEDRPDRPFRGYISVHGNRFHGRLGGDVRGQSIDGVLCCRQYTSLSNPCTELVVLNDSTTGLGELLYRFAKPTEGIDGEYSGSVQPASHVAVRELIRRRAVSPLALLAQHIPEGSRRLLRMTLTRH